jgi:membrane fusion protein, multidrug efflux system
MTRPGFRIYVLGITSLAVVSAGVLFLAVSRRANALSEAESRTQALAQGPLVSVVTVGQGGAARSVDVQGEARPYASVTLYAKVSGYLREIRVDKGDRVTAGQVLAVIESPELDRQYDGAVADAANKRANAKRAETLVEQSILSAQDADLARTAAEVADAAVASLASQKAYETLRAPFDGTVTARFADPGALVQNAASSQTSALPVVTVARTNRLRVAAYLNQADAPYVGPGDLAVVTVPGQTGLALHGTVSRVSHELDPRTRTMLAEVDIDNEKGRVVPGSFVGVSLKIASPKGVSIPVQALVLRGRQPFVAVVSDDDHVVYRSVEIADDDGLNAQIVRGISGGERVALNLGDTLADGAKVQVAPAR